MSIHMPEEAEIREYYKTECLRQGFRFEVGFNNRDGSYEFYSFCNTMDEISLLFTSINCMNEVTGDRLSRLPRITDHKSEATFNPDMGHSYEKDFSLFPVIYRCVRCKKTFDQSSEPCE